MKVVLVLLLLALPALAPKQAAPPATRSGEAARRAASLCGAQAVSCQRGAQQRNKSEERWLLRPGARLEASSALALARAAPG